MYKKISFTALILLLLQGCVAKNQDMYAEQTFQDKQERAERKGKVFHEYARPVARGILAIPEGIGDMAVEVASNPELMAQGVKTYQQVEHEQQVANERAYRASSGLRKTSNSSSVSHQNSYPVKTNNSSGALHYNYKKATPKPKEIQMRECVWYQIPLRTTWKEGEGGKIYGQHQSIINYYNNKSSGEEVSCPPNTRSKCTLYKVGHKNYTFTRNGEVTHYTINYPVVKMEKQITETERCADNNANCTNAGICNSPSGVDSYIDSLYYDKSSTGGPTMQQ